MSVQVSGVVADPKRTVRRLGGVACIVCALTGAVWFAPLATLRRAPAPAWDALSWARERALATGASIVYDPEIVPHAAYLLAGGGVASYKRDEATTDIAELRERGDVLLVGPRPEPGTEVLRSRAWLSGRLARLTRGRYASAAVCRAAALANGPFPADLQPDGGRLSLRATGRVRRSPSDDAGCLTIGGASGAIVVRRAGAPAFVLPAGVGLEAVVFPGPAGVVDVGAVSPDGVDLEMVRLSSLSPAAGCSCLADAFIVPLAAHLIGEARSDWRTDLLLANPQPHDLELTMLLLPAGRDNSSAAGVGLTVPARRTILVRDVLGRSEAGGVGLAALVVRADPRSGSQDPRFAVLSRTRNLMASPTDSSAGEGLPGVPFSGALASGQRAEFRSVDRDAGRRVSVGFVSWSRAAMSAHVTVHAGDGRAVGEARFDLAPFEHRHETISLGPGSAVVEVAIEGALPGSRAVVYLSGVDQATGAPQHRLPDELVGAPATASTPEYPAPRP
jgi:hypothetical protein